MVAVPWSFASSVIIISRTTGRLLMMQRGPTAKFMPNAFVFPGGVLSSTDESLGPVTKIAALREAFEETGLCINEQGTVETAAEDQNLAVLQDEVNMDPATFRKVLEKGAVERLIDWSCWLTPTTYSRRFMTSFYLLPVDGEPSVRMCQREMANFGWATPAVWLEKSAAGNFGPPQTFELWRLSQIPVGDWVKYRRLDNAVLAPQVIFWDDLVHGTSVLPGDHLYIDEDAFLVQPRNMNSEHLIINPKRPTNRVQFKKRLWTASSVHQHCLEEPYRSQFFSFAQKGLSKI